MTRLTYKRALDLALAPHGFVRNGTDWKRECGEVEHWVDLQKSWIDGGLTINLFAKNLETERMIKAVPCEFINGISVSGQRIGYLIDGRDRWWKNNPDGPTELAEAMVTFGLPWFERVKTLEEQAAEWYGRGRKTPWRGTNHSALAMTLYRLGEYDEALAVFDGPVRRTANPTYVAKGRCVQRWLQAEVERMKAGRMPKN